MTPFKKIRWFQKTATAILCIFMGLMLLVVLVAYTRRSGSTGLDMAKIHHLRQKECPNTPSK